MKKILILLFGLITFCSCVRMNKYPLEKGAPISKNNINCINGIYYNFENKKFENFKNSFWYQLMVSYPDEFKISDSSFIKLEVINEKHINVSLIQNNNIISSKVLLYKIKNEELYFKTNIQTKGLPFILWTLYCTKSRINFKSVNEINCHTYSFSAGYFLLMGLPSDSWNNYVFNKRTP